MNLPAEVAGRSGNVTESRFTPKTFTPLPISSPLHAISFTVGVRPARASLMDRNLGGEAIYLVTHYWSRSKPEQV